MGFTEFVLNVSPQSEPEFNSPFYANADDEVSWKSEQNKLVFYNNYKSVVIFDGIIKGKYTYKGKKYIPIKVFSHG